MIRIYTGWSNLGGSTIAFINLVNLFNRNGIDATLFGPHDWAHGRTNFEILPSRLTPEGNLTFDNLHKIHETFDRDDIVITHYIPLAFRNAARGYLKKAIYSCHETDVFPVSKLDLSKYDFIHYVSDFQAMWHEKTHCPHIVIPNVLPNISEVKDERKKGVAGVIGSIDPHKRTHKAVEAAMEGGWSTVLIFGAVTNPYYFDKKVRPLIEANPEVVGYMGTMDDKEDMYSYVEKVYHASPRETFNYIEHECGLTNTEYEHIDGIYGLSEAWEEGAILEAWKEALCL